MIILLLFTYVKILKYTETALKTCQLVALTNELLFLTDCPAVVIWSFDMGVLLLTDTICSIASPLDWYAYWKDRNPTLTSIQKFINEIYKNEFNCQKNVNETRTLAGIQYTVHCYANTNTFVPYRHCSLRSMKTIWNIKEDNIITTLIKSGDLNVKMIIQKSISLRFNFCYKYYSRNKK